MKRSGRVASMWHVDGVLKGLALELGLLIFASIDPFGVDHTKIHATPKARRAWRRGLAEIRCDRW